MPQNNTMPESMPLADNTAIDYELNNRLIDDGESDEIQISKDEDMVFTKDKVNEPMEIDCQHVKLSVTNKQHSFANRCNNLAKSLAPANGIASGGKITRFGLTAKNKPKAKRPSFAARLNRPISINIQSTALSASAKGETSSRVDADLERGKYNIMQLRADELVVEDDEPENKTVQLFKQEQSIMNFLCSQQVHPVMLSEYLADKKVEQLRNHGVQAVHKQTNNDRTPEMQTSAQYTYNEKTQPTSACPQEITKLSNALKKHTTDMALSAEKTFSSAINVTDAFQL